MGALGVPSDVHIYTALIHGCQDEEDGLTRAEGVFEEMKRAGVAPDMKFYTNLIRVRPPLPTQHPSCPVTLSVPVHKKLLLNYKHGQPSYYEEKTPTVRGPVTSFPS
jgi:pentatricopeptide repeat protein